MNVAKTGVDRLREDYLARGHGGDRATACESQIIGVLASGGLDSSILIKCLLEAGQRVKPFYIRSGLCWQAEEERSLNRYLAAVAAPELEPLTVLELPLSDLYGEHWSVTGRNVPGANTPDEAVFLPGRNALLAIKAALWCQMHGVGVLAVATLRSNPFADASASFFHHLQRAFSAVQSQPFHLTRPFAGLAKQQVMELGRTFPLELTFSCIAPRRGLHCGQCNKCAERRAAFRLSSFRDLTCYASGATRFSLAQSQRRTTTRSTNATSV